MKPDFPYHRFGGYLKERFGQKVHKVSVDAGFSCPNRDPRDHSGGCAWCNNASFNPHDRASGRSPLDQLRLGVRLLRERLGVRLFIAYFQAYTNTYAPVAALRELFAGALAVDGVVGLAVGTRPDCVDEEKLALLEELRRRPLPAGLGRAERAAGQFVQIEYGLQSARDDTLARFQRGHTVADFSRAMALTRGRGLEICGHMITGLPGEDDADARRTLCLLRDSGVTGLKIHNLHIVTGSALAQAYEQAPFALPTLHGHAALVADLLEELPWTVNIQRLWAASTDHALHVAPAWSLNNNLTKYAIEQEFRKRGSWQGVRAP